MVQDFLKRVAPRMPWGLERGPLAEQPQYEVPGRCPVCSAAMFAVRLHCAACGTSLEGAFSLGRLYRLSAEQRRFVEIFVRCRGKIKDVGEELGLSYPTVVARLNEVIAALGFETSAATEGEDDRYAARAEAQQRILQDVAAGRLTAAEAAEWLRRLDP